MRPPLSSTPPWACLERAPTVIADMRLRVVTPMFGGGATPGASDADWPIRGSAIRGHLRFWWRACNARRFASLEAMYEEESRIWGAATKKGSPYGPGAISVRVDVTRGGTPSFHFHNSRGLQWKRRGWHHGAADDPNGQFPRGPSLALFPFTGAEAKEGRPAQPPAVGREDIEFRLRLSLAPHANTEAQRDECIKAAKQALWAWITFGGVGSRTRRGCGSLQCLEVIESFENSIPAAVLQPSGTEADDWVAGLRRWLVAQCQQLVCTGKGLPLVPSLAGSRVLADDPFNGSVSAWAHAVNPLHDFRQEPGVGRNPGSGPTPGESRWPEAAAVRELRDVNTYSGWNREITHKRNRGNPSGKDFPRADLGWPILFERIPHTPRLEGADEGTQRMASPIVLKALATPSGEFIPIAVMLNTPHPWDPGTPAVHLKDKRGVSSLSLSPMTSATPDWPWKNKPLYVDSSSSVRDAYMCFVEQDLGWKEVLP